MSALEETIKNSSVKTERPTKPEDSVVARFMAVLCSVRFGVVLLILLALACFIGMVVMQQNVDGFEQYYAELTPAQRLVYGSLGFFDIYHVWYFNALLALLSLNIVLASIDRFPKTWRYFRRPTVTVPLRWLREQKASAELEIEAAGKEAAVERVSEAFRAVGFKKIRTAEKNGMTFVFAQSGLWNRFGAYAVHVGLLAIFLGGFLTAQMGQNGNMALGPGQTSDRITDTVVELDKVNQVHKMLPFQIECTDIQQRLIKNDGPIIVPNTIDWITRIRIKDGNEVVEGTVQMNAPFDYRGYRFFQASFVPVGRARNVTVDAVSATTGESQKVTIPRDGEVTLKDGTVLRFAEFRGNFSLGKENPNEDTSAYPNPAAVLHVMQPGQSPQTGYAFGPKLADIPVASKPVGGYTFKLVDFEKVGDQHILAVQRDPGADVVYIGFTLLFITLVIVFFFSHRRIWAAIGTKSENEYTVTLGGHSNRNQQALNDKFSRLVGVLRNT